MIVGAGLAGLLTAHAMPHHTIVEREAAPRAAHRALLRFRSPAVSELTGVPFRPVTVHKGIWYEGDMRPADIHLANAYSRKVLGRLIDRSLWSLETVTRYVAPENFYERLIEAVGHRIAWGHTADFTEAVDGEAVINTAPIVVPLSGLGVLHSDVFHRAPITVKRYRVPGADVFQTVYFPGFEHTMYRASITGDLLIVEFAGEVDGPWSAELNAAFALPGGVHEIEEAGQSYGKIAPIDEGRRKALIAHLTRHYGVFSVGRFATWRNILLDDVVHDIAVVKRLIGANEYERHLAAL